MKEIEADRINRASAEVDDGYYYKLDPDLGWPCMIEYQKHKPVRAEIDYELFQKMKAELKHYKGLAEARANTARANADNSRVSLEQADTLIAEQGAVANESNR